jgi:hypothetical protein
MDLRVEISILPCDSSDVAVLPFDFGPYFFSWILNRAVVDLGGKLVYQYTKKRASGPKCPVTGKKIQGVCAAYLSVLFN